MKSSFRIFLLLTAVVLMAGCARKSGEVRAEIKTTEGNIVISLSDLTPMHRDNFIKLAESGFYNGVLFHRVIKDFMIQTGDGATKENPTGNIEDYTIPAEINDSLIHTRGAVAAARMGDDVNPDRNSSGTQFYIVQGKIYDDESLGKAEQRMEYNRRQYLYNHILDKLRSASAADTVPVNEDVIQQDALIMLGDTLDATGPVKIPEYRRELYKKEGGTPFLDGAYTVFGRVLEGMDVVDAIGNSATDMNDKPVKDVRIIEIKILK